MTLGRWRAAHLIASLQLVGTGGEYALESTASAAAADTTDGTGHNLIHEELNVGTPSSGTLAYARQTDIGWSIAQVKTTEYTADDLAATGNGTLPAVTWAIDAALKFFRFANPIAANTADPAIFSAA